MSSYEFVVVGGSFAGLAAATGIARVNRSVLVIDNGGNRNRFAEQVHNLVGFEGMSPSQVLEMSRRTTFSYPKATLCKGTVSKLENLSRDGEIKFKVTVNPMHPLRLESMYKHEGAVEVKDPLEIVCKRLILACGVTDDLPSIPGVEELWGGNGVAHCPHCHGYEVIDKKLGFLKTPNPMLPFLAKLLKELSSDVTLFANGDLTEEERKTWASAGVSFHEKKISKLIPLEKSSHRELKSVRFEDGTEASVDCFFIPGTVSLNKVFVDSLGLELSSGPAGSFIKTDPKTMETSVKGVYACGDVARAGHQTSWAIADGVLAGFMSHLSTII